MQYSNFWNGSKSFLSKVQLTFLSIRSPPPTNPSTPLYMCGIIQRTFAAWSWWSGSVPLNATLEPRFWDGAGPPPLLLNGSALLYALTAEGPRGRQLLQPRLFFLVDLCFHPCSRSGWGSLAVPLPWNTLPSRHRCSCYHCTRLHEDPDACISSIQSRTSGLSYGPSLSRQRHWVRYWKLPLADKQQKRRKWLVGFSVHLWQRLSSFTTLKLASESIGNGPFIIYLP